MPRAKTAKKKPAKKKTAKKKAAKKKAAKKKPAKKAAKKTAKKKAAKKATKKKAAKKKATKKKAAKKSAKTSAKAAKKKAVKKAAKKPEPPPTEEERDPRRTIAEGLKPPESDAKRQRVVKAILPRGTSARMAAQAKASVWAISSEKTQEMRSYVYFDDLDGEDPKRDGPPSAEERRSSRDAFGFLRAELERPEDDPSDPHASWRMSNQVSRHELGRGSTVESLGLIEERIGIDFPPSYWDFALEWGRGRLFVHPGGGFRVISPRQLLKEVRGPLCNRMNRPFLPVVDLGCGDYLALDTSKTNRSDEHPVYWWYGGEPKKKVADSFAQWLRKIIDARGHAYWWSL